MIELADVGQPDTGVDFQGCPVKEIPKPGQIDSKHKIEINLLWSAIFQYPH